MSLGFDCGQYEQAFNSRRLQSYEVRNFRRRRPQSKEGFTAIVANNRGHLLPSIPRSMKSPWGRFVGTWDMPSKIPGNSATDPMARTVYQHHMNCEKKADADVVIYGKTKRRREKAGPGQLLVPLATQMTNDDIPAQRSGAANPVVQVKSPRSPVPQANLQPPYIASPSINRELVKTPQRVSPLPCEDPKTGITPVLTPVRRSGTAPGTPKNL